MATELERIKEFLQTECKSFAEKNNLAQISEFDGQGLIICFSWWRFCCWDCIIRLYGVVDEPDWNRVLGQAEKIRAGLNWKNLAELTAKKGRDVLILALYFYCLEVVIQEFWRRIPEKKKGQKYLDYLDGNFEALNSLIQDITPKKASYYQISWNTHEDRAQDIQNALFAFIEKTKQSLNTKEWDWLSASNPCLLKQYRPVDNPEWETVGPAVLRRTIEENLEKFAPILSGKFDKGVVLEVRTFLRSEFESHYPGINFRKRPRPLQPKEVPLEKLGSKRLQQIGTDWDPEVIVGQKLARDRQQKIMQGLLGEDSALYFALKKHKSNKTKAARELGITRDGLDKRLKRILKKAEKTVVPPGRQKK
jgi:hypothetical protein